MAKRQAGSAKKNSHSGKGNHPKAPNATAKAPVPGSGRGHSAKGYVNGEWVK